jgi:surface antigen
MATGLPPLIAALVAAAVVAGCQSGGPTTTSLGYAAGSATTVKGGPIGDTIGRGLSGEDRRAALEAEYRALEFGRTGSPVEWRGRRGVTGEVVPGPPYRINETSCRDYTHTIHAGGEAESARGTACRTASGAWESAA